MQNLCHLGGRCQLKSLSSTHFFLSKKRRKKQKEEEVRSCKHLFVCGCCYTLRSYSSVGAQH